MWKNVRLTIVTANDAELEVDFSRPLGPSTETIGLQHVALSVSEEGSVEMMTLVPLLHVDPLQYISISIVDPESTPTDDLCA